MLSNRTIRYDWRVALILFIAGLVCVATLFAEPIAQSLSYHRLADQRTFLAIRNALDVTSNLPFLVIGSMGLYHCVRHPQRLARYSWPVFFIGVTLVAFGSAYYHWSPNNQTLAWDRLPMTVAFMGLLIALLSESIGDTIERLCLIPAVALGIGSVVYWRYTDDLRLYGLVQFGSLLMAPIVLLLFNTRFTHRRFLLYALIWYCLAKLCEAFDREIFVMTDRLLSGHTLKHLCAAAAVWCIYRMLRHRRFVVASTVTQQ